MTGTYLEGINTEEIISTVHGRRAPTMHASAGLARQQTRAGARLRSRSGPCSQTKRSHTSRRC
jgi:hypothetical protein